MVPHPRRNRRVVCSICCDAITLNRYAVLSYVGGGGGAGGGLTHTSLTLIYVRREIKMRLSKGVV